jgi:hypothetical protein
MIEDRYTPHSLAFNLLALARTRFPIRGILPVQPTGFLGGHPHPGQPVPARFPAARAFPASSASRQPARSRRSTISLASGNAADAPATKDLGNFASYGRFIVLGYYKSSMKHKYSTKMFEEMGYAPGGSTGTSETIPGRASRIHRGHRLLAAPAAARSRRRFRKPPESHTTRRSCITARTSEREVKGLSTGRWGNLRVKRQAIVHRIYHRAWIHHTIGGDAK